MGHIKIRDAISGMTFKQKVEYLWTYYKWVLLVAALVLFFANAVVTGIRNRQIETIYSGTLVNIDLSDEGTAFLSDDWLRHLDGSEKQIVELTSTYFQKSETSDPEMDAYSVMRVVAAVASQSLDYAIMDETAYDQYKIQGVFCSLEDAVSPALLAQFQAELVYETDEETGKTYPLAIDITDWAFTGDCITADETVYLSFCGNTGRTERNDIFLSYLLSWN